MNEKHPTSKDKLSLLKKVLREFRDTVKDDERLEVDLKENDGVEFSIKVKKPK